LQKLLFKNMPSTTSIIENNTTNTSDVPSSPKVATASAITGSPAKDVKWPSAVKQQPNGESAAVAEVCALRRRII
jgi:hypothetical protein